MKFSLENIQDGVYYFWNVQARLKEGWLEIWLILDRPNEKAKIKLDDGDENGPEMDIHWKVAMHMLEMNDAEIPDELYED